MGRKNRYRNNRQFLDSAILNNETFIDYLERLKKVALSIFEWVNLPKSMNPIWLEKTLFFNGQAALLYDENYGYLNTKCSANGTLNLYGLPTKLNCYSYGYQAYRNLFSGLTNIDNTTVSSCILVQNNWERIPTASTLELFAYRLYEAERTCDTNIKAMKTPFAIVTTENQLLTVKNAYQKYEGNEPMIIFDKNLMTDNEMKALKTEAPYVADKIMEYKKEIWNEALTFLGINNIMVDKKERLITDEANSNNELINLNLESYFAPRKLACEQFNELFGFKGTEKEISVRVRSDLHNIIKNVESSIAKYNVPQEQEEGENTNVELYNIS